MTEHLKGLGAVGALALAGLLAGGAAAQDSYEALGASLFGENEVGHEGAGEEASGDFEGLIDREQGTLCYYLEVSGLDTVTAAHIHKGGKASNGDPVVTLELTGEDGDEICVEVDAALLADMARNERSYYVNVHTEAFPAGAIRGQFGE